jgi:hypothetical protein
VFVSVPISICKANNRVRKGMRKRYMSLTAPRTTARSRGTQSGDKVKISLSGRTAPEHRGAALDAAAHGAGRRSVSKAHPTRRRTCQTRPAAAPHRGHHDAAAHGAGTGRRRSVSDSTPEAQPGSRDVSRDDTAGRGCRESAGAQLQPTRRPGHFAKRVGNSFERPLSSIPNERALKSGAGPRTA